MSLMNYTYASHLGKYGDYDVFAEIEKETNMPVYYRAIKHLDDKSKVVVNVGNKDEKVEWLYGLHLNDFVPVENKKIKGFNFYKKHIEKELSKIIGLGNSLESIQVYSLNFPEYYYNIMTEIIFKDLGNLDSHFNYALNFYEKNIKRFYENIFLEMLR